MNLNKEFLSQIKSKYSLDVLKEVLEPLEYSRILDVSWIDSVVIGSWSENSEGLIDVQGSVLIVDENFEYIPVKFGKVEKIFRIVDCNNLKSLRGFPIECAGVCLDTCSSLETLEGVTKVCKTFKCYRCEGLKTLKGAPEVCTKFSAILCMNLETLEGGPKSCKEYDLSGCFKLKNLEGIASNCRKLNCSGLSQIEDYSAVPKDCKIIGKVRNFGNYLAVSR